MSMTPRPSGAVRRINIVGRSRSALHSFSVQDFAEHVPELCCLPLCLFAAYVLLRYGALAALAAVALPALTYWITRETGRGFLLAVFILFTIPYFYSHVWLLPPVLGSLGLGAGVVRFRLSRIDGVVALLLIWFTFSWLLHPETHLSAKQFVESILPFGYYFGARLMVERNRFSTVQRVILLAATAAALSVLYEWASGTIVFSDPQRYQWGGSSTEILRAGGFFGGSPPAGIALSMVLLMSLPLKGTWKPLGRVAMAVIAVAIVVTVARAAYVGLAAGVLAFLVLLPLRHWRRLLFVIAVVATAGYMLASPTTLRSATQTQFVAEGLIRPGSFIGRLTLFDLGLQLVADTPSHLALGRGFEAFPAYGRADANAATTPLLFERGGPHNTYLCTILEEGLLGLILLVGWLVGCLAIGARACLRLSKGSVERANIAGLTAAVAAFAVSGLFHDLTHNVPDMSAVALASGLLVSVVRNGASSPTVGRDDVA